MASGNNLTTVSDLHFFPAPFEFEKNFDIPFMRAWSKRNLPFMPFICIEYLFLLFVCTRIMKKKVSVHLKWSLFVWDSSLALMSLLGAFRMGAELIYSLREHGFEYSVCKIGVLETNPVCATWISVFGFSKFLELFDTLFIVLRKQKLSFLHWFHHFSVMILSSFAITDEVAMGRWYGTMNFTMHAFMYSYFALRILKFNIPKVWGLILTLMQIFQMTAGGLLSAIVFFKWLNGAECSVSGRVIYIGAALYSVFFCLFLNFFINTFVRTQHPATKKVK